MLTVAATTEFPLKLARMSLEQREQNLAEINQSINDLSAAITAAYERGDSQRADECFNALNMMRELAKAQRAEIAVAQRRASFAVVR